MACIRGVGGQFEAGQLVTAIVAGLRWTARLPFILAALAATAQVQHRAILQSRAFLTDGTARVREWIARTIHRVRGRPVVLAAGPVLAPRRGARVAGPAVRACFRIADFRAGACQDLTAQCHEQDEHKVLRVGVELHGSCTPWAYGHGVLPFSIGPLPHRVCPNFSAIARELLPSALAQGCGKSGWREFAGESCVAGCNSSRPVSVRCGLRRGQRGSSNGDQMHLICGDAED